MARKRDQWSDSDGYSQAILDTYATSIEHCGKGVFISMEYTTLISTAELAERLTADDWVIVDCRFYLLQPDRGHEEYLASHIPGAVYAHMDHDLSSPVVPGKSGRHPLPDPETAAATFSSWGIGPGVQVVAYDASGGGMAARLWWLLRWLGHEAVAVLDGGWPLWLGEGRPTRSGQEHNAPRDFQPQLQEGWIVDTAEVATLPAEARLFDSRTAERYRGENETIDPVAGHIPDAISAPYTENLNSEARFLSADDLRKRFEQLLGETSPEAAVFYCGSGVTAAHNVLAMAHAGLGNARLYPGSWSEWITDPERPVAVGNE